MSQATVRGIVHLVEETKTYGQKGFRKRLVVLEQNSERFTNYIPLEFVQANCELADDLNEGDEIEAVYRLSGRKWQRDPGSEVKYFLSAEATSFKKIGGAPADHDGDAPPLTDDDYTTSGDDEVPF